MAPGSPYRAWSADVSGDPRPATGLELRDAIARGESAVRASLETAIRDLDAADRATGALCERFFDEALVEAEAADRRLAAGAPVRPLEGIPFTAKAVIATRTGRTHAGSRILEHHRATEDATAVARLRACGAILVGKTHCDEFAMGSSTENSALGIVRNPWDPTRVPGGSSGGAAALAGAVRGCVHLGSDTGGSIRQPAAYCGATGMKPTYGTVSRSGLVAFASSLDQIGPLARDARDVAAFLAAMSGRDPLDATTRAVVPADLLEAPSPRRIGVPREYLGAAIEPETRAAVEAAIETLRADGAVVVEVELPTTPHANACYQVLSTAEASSNLARYDGVHIGRRAADPEGLADLYSRSRADGFGPEVRRRILLGTFVLSAAAQEAYYRRALRVRRRIADDFARAFAAAEVLIAPTSPFPAFRLGERVTDPLALYACDILTVGANLAGIPAISLPGGRSAAGLPLGVQFLGPWGGDGAVLAVARRFQQLTDHHRALPEAFA